MTSHRIASDKDTLSDLPSTLFPRAIVYWLTDRKIAEPREAWLCISTSLRWVFVGSGDPVPLADFSSFRGHFCLSLERLQDHAVWEDVEKEVKPFDGQLGPAFVVSGKLSGRNVSLVKNRRVQLVVISSSVDERNALMNVVRIRISPWQLLHRRMKELLLDARLSDKALKALFVTAEKSYGTILSCVHKEPSTFVEAVEEGAPVAEGLNLLSGIVETASTVVKKSVPLAKDVAEEVADFAKCVTIVSSALQVVVMCASLAEMGIEMKRGTVEWPRIRARVKDLHGAIVKSMIPVLHPEGHVDELLVKNVFEVQQELVDVLADVEKEMMRHSGLIQSVKRFLRASELKRIERDLDRLKACVLQVVQSSSIANIRRTVGKLERNALAPVDVAYSKPLEDIQRTVGNLEQNVLLPCNSIVQNSKTLEDIRRTAEKMEQNPLYTADTFKSYFDSPYLPPNLVFDFDSCDENGSYVTPEGTLLHAVLHLRENGNSQGASVIGTHGMGGVGKTTTLKRLCKEESVRSLFADGVCFMQFGQNATLQKVRDEMYRCVRNFGGAEVAKDMKSAANLGGVVNRAVEWLKERRVLLVCDDLWATADNELGYVHELKRMLRDAPQSGLLISTRDRTIARAVASSPVSFKCLQPCGPKAKEILSKAAFGLDWQQIIHGWGAELEYTGILGVCAGLPLALGIAGRGVNVDYEDCGDASFAVRNYWDGLQEGGLEHLQGTNSDYHEDGLKYIVQASLKLCEVWGRKGRRNYDMRQLFRSLCVLEKQQSIPESTLKLFWRLEKRQVGEVVRKFANLNIAKRELLDLPAYENRKAPQFCLRLHDLVLELCQEMEIDEQDSWHISLINAYRLTLDDSNATETHLASWWKVQDDGYVSENLSRHLVASGSLKQLEMLLSDVRWTLRRYEMGGWAALDLDFKRLLVAQTGLQKNEMRKLHSLLKRCWSVLSRDRSLFAFNVFGNLSKRERLSKNVSMYLNSVTEHFPSPWLYPMTKCVGPEDSREQSRWNIQWRIKNLSVSWSSDRVIIVSDSGIHVWSLTLQEELFLIPTWAYCASISEDGKLIVSGHEDGTVRRWNAISGEAVGMPMSGHTQPVCSVAIRGNLIVSGSLDKSLYRWNASSGEAIDSALRGHKRAVLSVAISADGKLIVSGSNDKTIRRWDAATGELVGSPILGHSSGVRVLAISFDGEVILSGSIDKTVQRWKAKTGEAIGEPLRGHNGEINGLAISEDGRCIVSSSGDCDVRLWNALSGEAIGLPLRGHESSVSGIAISRDGNLVLSGSFDMTVRQWDVSAQGNVSEQYRLSIVREENLFCPKKNVLSVVVCANGKLAVSSSNDNTVQRWDILTGEAVGRPMLGHTGRGGVHCVAISRDGTLIVTGGSDKMVRRWDGLTGEVIGEPMVGHSGSVRAVVISDDGKLIVSGANDTTVRRWNAKTGQPIGKPMEGHSHGIADLGISVDSNIIVSGSWEMMQRWNAATGEKIGGRIKVQGCARNVVISNNGKIITCAVPLSYVQQWETMTGKPIGEQMKWSVGQDMLDEMKRARLCGDRKCDGVVRKDTFPIETVRRAVCPDTNKVVLGLQNGSVVVCERR